MKEPLNFKSPKISMQNTISFTCSDTAVNTLFTILCELKQLGELGASREVVIDGRAYFFDGDGSDQVDYIKVNGLSIDEWNKEKRRLGELTDED